MKLKTMPNDLLITTYLRAVHHNLDPNFIKILFEELDRRNLLKKINDL